MAAELDYATVHGDEESTDTEQFGDDLDIDKMVGKKRGHINVIVPPVPLKRHKRVIGSGYAKANTSTIDQKKDDVPKKIEIAPIVSTKPNMKIDPKIVAKPPLPPKPNRSKVVDKVPRVRVKVEENNNASTVQKLSAQADQLRLEISELRTALAVEKSAVRGLR